MNTHKLIKLAEKHMINEGGLSRIQQAISDPSVSFAIISASRNENTPEQNKELTKQLMKEVAKYGFVKLQGGYIENSNGEDVVVTEKSVMVRGIPKEEALALGKKYNQDSILWKDSDGMRYINRDGSEYRFKTDGFKTGNDYDLKSVGQYFSRRLQGSNKRNPIAFKDENLYLAEYNYNNSMSRFMAERCKEPESSYKRIL